MRLLHVQCMQGAGVRLRSCLACPFTACSGHHLCSSSNAEEAAAGATQAAVWQQNAAAWAERLGRQYPLYRDVAQPIQLAVQELRYGLALMAGSTALAEAAPASQLAPVLARLMAFPRAAAAASGNGFPAAVQLDSPAVQQAVADAAAAAASEARSQAAAAAAIAPGGDVAEQAKRGAYAASMSARLQLLRCSLSAAARDAEAARLGSGGGAGAQASAAAVAAAQQRLHAIFGGESCML